MGANQIFDRQLMKLTTVPATHVDAAWKDGASCLADACNASGGEITGDQLKMLCSRGERVIVRMDDENHVAGWGVVRIDQMPNFRVLYVCEMVAPGESFERFFKELKNMAVALGCSRIRCAAKPAQERLYKMKCNFQPVYQILEVTL